MQLPRRDTEGAQTSSRWEDSGRAPVREGTILPIQSSGEVMAIVWKFLRSDRFRMRSRPNSPEAKQLPTP